MKSPKYTVLLLGIIASLFFAITFVVNRLMALEGGSWIWSASLRFFWMVPFFFAIVLARKNLGSLVIEMKKNLGQWLLWSTIGFGLFYGPLTFAAVQRPSWLVASSWQITIIAGLLLAPMINPNLRGISGTSFIFSGIILSGIVIMQVNHAQNLTFQNAVFGFIPVLIAAFAYPLGNRKMMQITKGKLDVYQRILGMLIGSLPFWLVLSCYELLVNQNTPLESQYLQTLIVAICSGVIATALFFYATDKVSHNEKSLAAVEATQSAEVLFALAGEIILLKAALPDVYSSFGIVLILIGMLLHSFWRNKK